MRRNGNHYQNIVENLQVKVYFHTITEKKEHKFILNPPFSPFLSYITCKHLLQLMILLILYKIPRAYINIFRSII
jgi:hypothetical protein